MRRWQTGRSKQAKFVCLICAPSNISFLRSWAVNQVYCGWNCGYKAFRNYQSVCLKLLISAANTKSTINFRNSRNHRILNECMMIMFKKHYWIYKSCYLETVLVCSCISRTICLLWMYELLHSFYENTQYLVKAINGILKLWTLLENDLTP